MGHVTKSVARSAGAAGAHAWVMRVIRLGIEGVWKLSIKGSLAGVDKWSGSPGAVRGGARILLRDLG